MRVASGDLAAPDCERGRQEGSRMQAAVEQQGTKSTFTDTPLLPFFAIQFPISFGKIPGYGIVVTKEPSGRRLRMRP